MSSARFEAPIYKINDWTIVSLPESASKALPSRGVTMVEGTMNDVAFKAALEPDGKGSHWLHVDKTLGKAMDTAAGETVVLEIKATDDWLEPELPDDLKAAFDAASAAAAQWGDITTIARWDWIRWIRATKVAATRAKRINTAIDMLEHGKRRPCCFNRSQCTEPAVSKSGVLITAAG
ncbi:YdeI/OmpD-associated family protein [Kordiimonas aestuarii]|uniref:YdeI/OmpD-associated family protein n=1 Tax=Kordiimonas aestuarii TaxID=1005925 RepID=UPI0021D17FD0|nr:YdeI/OmpD-associated family protein [Kordiimonas aestuarii]